MSESDITLHPVIIGTTGFPAQLNYSCNCLSIETFVTILLPEGKDQRSPRTPLKWTRAFNGFYCSKNLLLQYI